jgi:putative hydrolase of the HAD superfamily
MHAPAELRRPAGPLDRRVDGVSFDVWMTLIASNPTFKPARARRIAEAFGLDGQAADRLPQAIRRVDIDCDRQSETIGVQYGPVDRLRRVADDVGASVPDGALADEVQAMFADHLPTLTEPGVLTVLSDLRAAGVRTALLSNTGFVDGRYMRPALDALGILPLVDAAVFSDETGCAKPSPRIFAELADRIGLAPSSVLHVGDNRRADVDGATAAGMQALHLSAEPGPGSVTTLLAVPSLVRRSRE